MKRIVDANLNRATEALRALEEIARFYLNNEALSLELKNIRHELCTFFDSGYFDLIESRDTDNDVGTNILNPTKRRGIETIFKANFKRLEQALRVLSEYGGLDDSKRYRAYSLEKKMYKGLKMELKKYLLADKKLYLVTNSDNFASDQEFLDKVACALKSGVDMVQLREKKRTAKEIISLAIKIRQLCSMYNALFIVNDRIDIAQIAKADGVHLGQDDIDIKSARDILGENILIGISTHKPEDAINAKNNGADYIGVGPVFKTPTKPGRIPVGLEYVKWVKENIDIPFYAIGSIDNENIDDVIKAGASRVAVVRSIMNSSDIASSVQNFKSKLNQI